MLPSIPRSSVDRDRSLGFCCLVLDATGKRTTIAGRYMCGCDGLAIVGCKCFLMSAWLIVATKKSLLCDSTQVYGVTCFCDFEHLVIFSAHSHLGRSQSLSPLTCEILAQVRYLPFLPSFLLIAYPSLWDSISSPDASQF